MTLICILLYQTAGNKIIALTSYCIHMWHFFTVYTFTNFLFPRLQGMEI